MGQKANIMSIRKPFDLLHRSNTFLSEKQYIQSFVFLKHLNQNFKRKNFLITNTIFTTQPRINYLSISIYVQYRAWKKMKRKFFKVNIQKKQRKKLKHTTKNKKKNKKNQTINTMMIKVEKRKIRNNLFKKHKVKLNKLFNQQIWNNVQTNLTVLKFKFLNKNITKKEKQQARRLLRPSNIIFKRKYNMFKDLIGLSCLFIKHLISTEVFNNLLTLLLSRQSKRTQNRYFLFLRGFFSRLITLPNSQISGMKMLINGRLKGKLRADSIIITSGRIGNQSLEQNVEYSKATAYTINGTYGVHLWVNYHRHEDYYFDK